MIDAHAHLQDEKYENIEEVINKAKIEGVDKIVCASSDVETSKKALELACTYNNVYATIGIHPHDADNYNDGAMQTLIELAKNKKVVAIGEIGLDYHYMFSSKENQKNAFIEQIKLANQLRLPIVVHSRDATGDTIEILKNNLDKLKNGVCIHCFNMSLEILKEITKHGFYISIGGIVTFKNASNIIDIVRECDITKLMLETDSPYLTPVPFRSKVNEPKYVKLVAEKIAEIRGISLDKLIKITTDNAKRFFNL